MAVTIESNRVTGHREMQVRKLREAQLNLGRRMQIGLFLFLTLHIPRPANQQLKEVEEASELSLSLLGITVWENLTVIPIC